jgi:hypothetical protein
LFILDLFVLYHGDDLKEVAATNLIALLWIEFESDFTHA